MSAAAVWCRRCALSSIFWKKISAKKERAKGAPHKGVPAFGHKGLVKSNLSLFPFRLSPSCGQLLAVSDSFAGLRLGHGHVLATHVHLDGAAIGGGSGVEHGNRAAAIR